MKIVRSILFHLHIWIDNSAINEQIQTSFFKSALPSQRFYEVFRLHLKSEDCSLNIFGVLDFLFHCNIICYNVQCYMYMEKINQM